MRSGPAPHPRRALGPAAASERPLRTSTLSPAPHPREAPSHRRRAYPRPPSHRTRRLLAVHPHSRTAHERRHVLHPTVTTSSHNRIARRTERPAPGRGGIRRRRPRPGRPAPPPPTAVGAPRAPLPADQGVRRTSPAIAVGAATVRGGRRCAQPTASMRASGCGQRAVDNLGRGDPPLRTVFHRLVDPCGNWGSTTVSFVHTCGHRCGELWITLSTALSTTGDNRAVSALETSRARPRYPLRRGRP